MSIKPEGEISGRRVDGLEQRLGNQDSANRHHFPILDDDDDGDDDGDDDDEEEERGKVH